MEIEMEEAIVLYSTPEHLNSFTCLATFIAKHHPSISIILLTTAAAPAASPPSITFHRLPTPSLPPNTTTFTHLDLFFEIPRLNNPNFQQALIQISRHSNIRAIVLDFFCNYAYEVATTFRIPTYFCHTAGASALCALLHWPTVHQKTGGKLDDDTVVEIPGCPFIPSPDIPEMQHFPQSLGYKHLYDTANNIRKSAGAIVNTFYALEARALEALNTGLCTPKAETPPVYAMGPLIPVDNNINDDEDGVCEHECLRWLDLQPRKSVIFLCFGRRGSFSALQLREMAVGLENCGYRFLWAVRDPPELLPEGFLERIGERGFVLMSWAPQRELLSHDSVGGFVTHCGQSSMLEAVWYGVPMIGWPLYAEQRMNRVFMVEEMKVALHVEAAGESGLVTAEELGKKVRELMESERGKEIGRRVKELKFSAAAAVTEGGSSLLALQNFVAAVTRTTS